MAWQDLQEDLEDLFNDFEPSYGFKELGCVSLGLWAFADKLERDRFSALEQQILHDRAVTEKIHRRREIMRKAVRKYRAAQRDDAEKYKKLRTVANAAKMRRNKQKRLLVLQDRRCACCGGTIADTGKGPVRKFCSARCGNIFKMRSWRKKQASKLKLKRGR